MKADTGEELHLDRAELVGVGDRTALLLSAEKLQWHVCEARFEAVVLRADRPLHVAKIIWFSYDPREHKAGVSSPQALE